MEGGVVGVVTQFYYLGDVLGSEGGAERAVRAEWLRRGGSGWRSRGCY